MAITYKGTLGTGSTSVGSTSTTTCAFTTTTTTVEADEIAIVVSSSDNTSTSDGDNNEVTSITDTSGNPWTKLGEYTNSPSGAAGDGVTCSVWMSQAVNQLPIGSTVTAHYGVACVDKVLTGAVYSVSLNASVLQSAAPIATEVTGAPSYGSATFSGLQVIERLYFRGLSKEANSTTSMTPTAGFTVTGGGRSQNLASAVMVRAEFEITTAAGSTSNPSHVTGDSAALFFAIEELVSNPTRDIPKVSLRMTGYAPSFGLVVSLPGEP